MKPEKVKQHADALTAAINADDAEGMNSPLLNLFCGMAINLARIAEAVEQGDPL